MIPLARQQIVDMHRAVGAQAPTPRRQLDVAVLHVEGIEVDDHEHQVACRRPNVCCSRAARGLSVGMETQAPVALERRVVAPDLVDLRDQLGEAVRLARNSRT